MAKTTHSKLPDTSLSFTVEPARASYDVSQFNSSPTAEQYEALQRIYDYFNALLFKGKLPPVIFTIEKTKGAKGYYAPDTWRRQGFPPLATISINPEILLLPPIQWVSTIIHEMVHHLIWHRKIAVASGYHCREFAKAMFEVGLVASDTGKPGGKQVGRSMSHYILAGGPYELAFLDMPEAYWLPFKPMHLGTPEAPKGTSDRNKHSYSCPSCALKVWGKPNLLIICAACRLLLAPNF